MKFSKFIYSLFTYLLFFFYCLSVLFFSHLSSSIGSAIAQPAKNKNKQQVDQALIEIKKIELKRKENNGRLTQLYESPEISIKKSVLRAVARMRLKRGQQLALNALTSPDDELKLIAAWTLTQLKSVPLSQWLPPLIKKRSDVNDHNKDKLTPWSHSLRASLAKIVGESRDPDAALFLTELIDMNEDLSVIEGALKGLHRLLDHGVQIPLTSKHIAVGLHPQMSLLIRQTTAQFFLRIPTLSKLISLYIKDDNQEVQMIMLRALSAPQGIAEATRAWSSGQLDFMKATAHLFSHKDSTPMVILVLQDLLKLIKAETESLKSPSSKAGSSKAGSSKAGSSKASSSKAGSSKAGSSKAGSSDGIFQHTLSLNKSISAYIDLMNNLLTLKKISPELFRTARKIQRALQTLERALKKNIKQTANQDLEGELQTQKTSGLEQLNIIDLAHLKCRFAALIDLKKRQPTLTPRCSSLPELTPLIEDLIVKVLLRQKGKRNRSALIKLFKRSTPSTQIQILSYFKGVTLDQRVKKFLQNTLTIENPQVLAVTLKVCAQHNLKEIEQEVINIINYASLSEEIHLLITGIQVIETLKIEGTTTLLKEYIQHHHPDVVSASERAFLSLNKGSVLPFKKSLRQPPNFKSRLSTKWITPSPHTHAIIKTTRGDIKVQLYSKRAIQSVKRFVKFATRGVYNNLILNKESPYTGILFQGELAQDKRGKTRYQLRTHSINKSRVLNESDQEVDSWRSLLSFSFDRYDNGAPFLHITRGRYARPPHVFTPFAIVTQGEEILDRLKIGDQIQSIEFIP